MPRKTLYHYTDKDGAKGIASSGKIWQSEFPKDAVYGNGTYLTDMSPNKYSKQQIAKNLWDGSSNQVKQVIQSGKTDYVIPVKIPQNQVKVVVSYFN